MKWAELMYNDFPNSIPLLDPRDVPGILLDPRDGDTEAKAAVWSVRLALPGRGNHQLLAGVPGP